jgi:hypothetical protein
MGDMMGKAKDGRRERFHSPKPRRRRIRRGDGGWVAVTSGGDIFRIVFFIMNVYVFMCDYL